MIEHYCQPLLVSPFKSFNFQTAYGITLSKLTIPDTAVLLLRTDIWKYILQKNYIINSQLEITTLNFYPGVKNPGGDCNGNKSHSPACCKPSSFLFLLALSPVIHAGTMTFFKMMVELSISNGNFSLKRF